MTDLSDLITAAAARHGVDPNALLAVGRVESGLDPNARNPRSSAGGLFQFIDSTAKQYGLADRFDPAAAADAGARLMHDNGQFLQTRLGRTPTAGELYLAHQQGPGGAAKLLANPDAPAASLVGDQAVALNGGRPGMTAGQFAALWRDRLQGAQGPTVASAAVGPAPATPKSLGDLMTGTPTAAPAQPGIGSIASQFMQQSADESAKAKAAADAEGARRQALFGDLGRSFG